VCHLSLPGALVTPADTWATLQYLQQSIFFLNYTLSPMERFGKGLRRI